MTIQIQDDNLVFGDVKAIVSSIVQQLNGCFLAVWYIFYRISGFVIMFTVVFRFMAAAFATGALSRTANDGVTRFDGYGIIYLNRFGVLGLGLAALFLRFLAFTGVFSTGLTDRRTMSCRSSFCSRVLTRIYPYVLGISFPPFFTS